MARDTTMLWFGIASRNNYVHPCDHIHFATTNAVGTSHPRSVTNSRDIIIELLFADMSYFDTLMLPGQSYVMCFDLSIFATLRIKVLTMLANSEVN